MSTVSINIPKETWVEISSDSVDFQALGNDVYVTESGTIPMSKNHPAKKCLADKIYTYTQKGETLYGYSKEGSMIVMDTI